MTPFQFSLLYFIQQKCSSFIWFYCFFRFVALFACVWKRSFSLDLLHCLRVFGRGLFLSICCTVCVCLEEVFFIKLFLLFSSLFVLFLIFFIFLFLFSFGCFVLLFCFVFVFFPFSFSFSFRYVFFSSCRFFCVIYFSVSI